MVGLAGRLGVGGVLATGGLSRLAAPTETTQTLAEAGVPAASHVAVGTGILELLGGFALVLGVATPVAAGALATMCGIALWLVGNHVVAGSPLPPYEPRFLLVLVVTLLLVATHPGRLCVDRLVGARRPHRRPRQGTEWPRGQSAAGKSPEQAPPLHYSDSWTKTRHERQ